jgi:hypothetical protein
MLVKASNIAWKYNPAKTICQHTVRIEPLHERPKMKARQQ